MKAVLMIVGGISIALSALWGGAWLLDGFDGRWWGFPTFISAAAIFLGGIVIAAVGAAEAGA